MDAFHRCLAGKIGPGGMGCACCAPRPGKGRRKLRKLARAKMRAQLRNELLQLEQEWCEEHEEFEDLMSHIFGD